MDANKREYQSVISVCLRSFAVEKFTPKSVFIRLSMVNKFHPTKPREGLHFCFASDY